MDGMLDPSRIDTRYAKSGTLNIAYQVFGEGDVDLVFIPGWASTSRTSATRCRVRGVCRKAAVCT